MGNSNQCYLVVTTVGRSGIIQPSILYKKSQNTYSQATDTTNTDRTTATNTPRTAAMQIQHPDVSAIDGDVGGDDDAGGGGGGGTKQRRKTPDKEIHEKSPETDRKLVCQFFFKL